MIVTPRISLGKLLRFTWPRSFILVAFTTLSCVAITQISAELLRALSYAAGLLGTALAFLIGFRNNSAYARWWEAHRVWSQLKYESRSFALLVLSLVTPQTDLSDIQQKIIRRQIAFAWILNRFLRNQPIEEAERSLLDATEFSLIAQRHTPPLTILELQGRSLRDLLEAGALDSYRFTRLTDSIRSFNEVLSSCERIKKTPFPMQYTWFMNYTLIVFLLVLPLSLAGHLAWWSAPFSLLIGYAFIMLEYVGRHIETPFENAVNDVPLNYLSREIEIDLREILGETDIPLAVPPVGKGYLY